MIKNLAIFLATGTLALAAFILLERKAEKKPGTKFSRWWRKHIVSDTHKEE
jgi:hypothetical protein